MLWLDRTGSPSQANPSIRRLEVTPSRNFPSTPACQQCFSPGAILTESSRKSSKMVPSSSCVEARRRGPAAQVCIFVRRWARNCSCTCGFRSLARDVRASRRVQIPGIFAQELTKTRHPELLDWARGASRTGPVACRCRASRGGVPPSRSAHRLRSRALSLVVSATVATLEGDELALHFAHRRVARVVDPHLHLPIWTELSLQIFACSLRPSRAASLPSAALCSSCRAPTRRCKLTRKQLQTHGQPRLTASTPLHAVPRRVKLYSMAQPRPRFKTRQVTETSSPSRPVLRPAGRPRARHLYTATR